MNIKQFREVFKMAQSDKDLSNEDFDNLYGCALADFKPVSTTIGAIARLMRWQAHFMNGSWDMEEIDKIRKIGRLRFIVLD